MVQKSETQSFTKGVSFGVADGVGGWTSTSVDPSLFSQALMYHAHQFATSQTGGKREREPILDTEQPKANDEEDISPKTYLRQAYHRVIADDFVNAGGSTACIITMNAYSGLLHAANLGDSGFLIFRSSKLLYKQKPQTHGFNTPKQLSKIPPTRGRRMNDYLSDSPATADTYSALLRDGDIIIAYTDGLSDNVFVNEMLHMCSAVAREQSDYSADQQAQSIADNLVYQAHLAMANQNKISPFELESRLYGHYSSGGKPDDVTVVVALVRETS